jgi:hypothetical protein
VAVAPEPLRLFPVPQGDRDGDARSLDVVPVSSVAALQAVGEAATRLKTARCQLAETIARARASGLSWRAIGQAAGLPYQTLHNGWRRQAAQ